MVTVESSDQCLNPSVTHLVQQRLVIVTVAPRVLSATVVHSVATEGFASAMLKISISVAKT